MSKKVTGFERLTAIEETEFSKACKSVYGEAEHAGDSGCNFPTCSFDKCKCRIAAQHHEHQERRALSVKQKKVNSR